MNDILDPVLRFLVAKVNATATLDFRNVHSRHRRPHGPHCPRRLKVNERSGLKMKGR